MDVVLGDYFSTESDWTNEIKHNNYTHRQSESYNFPYVFFFGAGKWKVAAQSNLYHTNFDWYRRHSPANVDSYYNYTVDCFSNST